MEEKKRKKLSITEAGGDHAASIHSGGSLTGKNDIGFTLSQSVNSNTSNVSTYCPVCKRSYQGNSFYGHRCSN